MCARINQGVIVLLNYSFYNFLFKYVSKSILAQKKYFFTKKLKKIFLKMMIEHPVYGVYRVSLKRFWFWLVRFEIWLFVAELFKIFCTAIDLFSYVVLKFLQGLQIRISKCLLYLGFCKGISILEMECSKILTLLWFFL